jgi:hypothetical protein
VIVKEVRVRGIVAHLRRHVNGTPPHLEERTARKTTNEHLGIFEQSMGEATCRPAADDSPQRFNFDSIDRASFDVLTVDRITRNNVKGRSKVVPTKESKQKTKTAVTIHTSERTNEHEGVKILPGNTWNAHSEF